jgi:hypothetical protein
MIALADQDFVAVPPQRLALRPVARADHRATAESSRNTCSLVTRSRVERLLCQGKAGSPVRARARSPIPASRPMDIPRGSACGRSGRRPPLTARLSRRQWWCLSCKLKKPLVLVHVEDNGLRPVPKNDDEAARRTIAQSLHQRAEPSRCVSRRDDFIECELGHGTSS